LLREKNNSFRIKTDEGDVFDLGRKFPPFCPRAQSTTA